MRQIVWKEMRAVFKEQILESNDVKDIFIFQQNLQVFMNSFLDELLRFCWDWCSVLLISFISFPWDDWNIVWCRISPPKTSVFCFTREFHRVLLHQDLLHITFSQAFNNSITEKDDLETFSFVLLSSSFRCHEK